MIKWKGGVGDRLLIGIGLEEGNITRLKAGQPLVINGTEMGLDYDILVHYGKDHAALIKEMTKIADLKETEVSEHKDEPPLQ